MNPIDFDRYRIQDGSIDLLSAFAAEYEFGSCAESLQARIMALFQSIEDVRRIHSRQVASIAMACAANMMYPPIPRRGEEGTTQEKLPL